MIGRIGRAAGYLAVMWIAGASPVSTASTIVRGIITGEKLAVFIGEQQSLEALPSLCGEDKDCWAVDAEYLATYRVVRKIDGEPGADSVSFKIFTHAGPIEPEPHRTAVIFMWTGSHGNVMAKYSDVTVYPTTNGKWASCGDPDPTFIKRSDPRIRKIEFTHEVELGTVGHLTREGELSTGDDDGDRYPTPVSETLGGRVLCRTCVYVDEFAPSVASRIREAARRSD